MSAETIRVLLAVGIFMMLLLLRLEAERFGAAEYDEPGRKRGPWTRTAWYVIGGLLLAALYVVHPAPNDTLMMLIGHRPEAVVVGLVLAALGIAQAAAFAWFHYGCFRLPPLRAYPNAAVNAIGTAVVDEAVFRGALLGTLLSLGVPGIGAVLEATIVYLLFTRLAGPRRHPYMPSLAAAMGLGFGFATVATGGLGAAIVGHVVTSFAVFVFTGHAGQVAAAGAEPEEIAALASIPEGWQDARQAPVPARDAGARGITRPDGR
jgi:hypothetical protein